MLIRTLNLLFLSSFAKWGLKTWFTDKEGEIFGFQKIDFVRGSALLAYVGLRLAHLGARLANIGACWRQDGVKMEQ